MRTLSLLPVALLALAGCATPTASASSAPVSTQTSEPQASRPAWPTESSASAPSSTPPTETASSPTPLPQSKGTLDKESVRKVIGDRRRELQDCYEKEADKHPSLKGKVVARFVIGEAGKVDSTDMSSSQLPSKPVVDCVEKVFQSMQFPPPQGGIVVITYPLEFSQVTTVTRGPKR